MGVLNESGINEAVEQLLTPRTEQGKQTVPEQETLDEETLEVEEVEEDATESEEEEGTSDELEVGDDSEDDESLEDDETPNDEFYTVKVDGEEFEVNLEELKKGYQLEKNYTKKTQALAEEKKELESLKAQLEQERDRYLQVNQQLAQQSNAALEAAKAKLKAIDKQEDPIGYVQQQLEVQEMEEGLRQQIHNYQAAMTQKQAQDQQRLQQYLVQQDAILKQELSGWSDPEQAKAIKDGIAKFAMTQGYSQDELANVNSAKDIIVLNKARLYDELMAKKATVREKRSPKKPTPKIRSAAKKSDQTIKARRVKATKDKLKSSGTVKDAQALFMEMMTSRQPVRK